MADVDGEYAILKSEWRIRLQQVNRSSETLPKRAVLKEGIRRRCGVHFTDREWADLIAGRPVEAAFVNHLAAVIADAQSTPLTGVDVADPTGDHPTRERGQDYWIASYWEMMREVFGGLRPPPEAAFARDLSEVNEIADGILLTVGRWFGGRVNRRVSEAVAFDNAERHLQHKRDDFRGLLRRLWELDPRMVMFACTKDARIGATVVMPLTQDAAFAFRRGELDTRKLGAEHVSLGSRYCLLLAAGERTDLDLRATARISLAHLRNLFYQGGAICAYQDRPENDVVVLSFCGFADAARRLEAKGFRPVGATTPVTHYPILEHARPKRGVIARFNYGILQNYMRAYHELERGDSIK